MKKIYQILVLSMFSCFLTSCNSCNTDSFVKEDIAFYNNDTKLSGTIVFPNKGTIHAAVVFVSGSGMVTRYTDLAEKFASEGIAALVYDKRGVGKSDGNFITGFCPDSCLTLLADDASAAVDYLNNHKKTEHIPIGLTGISQAGWIVPIAAVKNPNVKFIALWSAPVCKLSEEDIFSQYSSDRDFDNFPKFEQILQMRKEPYQWDENFGRNIDAIESLTLLDIPGFWIFGLNDGSIPADLSISNLKKLKEQGRDKIEYVAFSNFGHSLINETFSTMSQWIIRTANGRSFTSKSKTINRQDFQKYLGIYTSNELPFKITIASQEGNLVAIFPSGSGEIMYVGNNSFYYHDYGVGFGWLDFDPNAGTLIVSQTGKTYNFKKAN